MHLSLPIAELKRYVGAQLSHFFPDGGTFEGADVDAALDLALDRAEFCFKHVAARGYADENGVSFSHLHSDQYTHFLYLLGNSLWQTSQNKALCDKLTLLNRSLHGIFLSYKVALPKIMHFAHAMGTVLGHAHYEDFLVVFQNVTVASMTPAASIGKGVVLSAGSMILGSKPVGARSSIGAGTLLFEREIPPDSVVFTDSGGEQQVRMRKSECTAQQFFNVEID